MRFLSTLAFFLALAACASVEPDDTQGTSEDELAARVTVALYRDFTCTTDLLSVLSPRTNCDALGHANAWRVRIGTKCLDVGTVAQRDACRRFKAAASTDGVGLYGMPTCAPDDLIAYVDKETDCTALAATTTEAAWGARLAGTCTDIGITSLIDACTRYKHQPGTGGVELFSDDLCGATSGATKRAAVGPETDCDRLPSPTADVWSVRFAGHCYDIKDTTAKSACHAYKTAAEAGAIPVFHNRGCAEGTLVGAVSAVTSCSAFVPNVTSDIASIMLDHVCTEVEPMSSADACARLGGAP